MLVMTIEGGEGIARLPVCLLSPNAHMEGPIIWSPSYFGGDLKTAHRQDKNIEVVEDCKKPLEYTH